MALCREASSQWWLDSPLSECRELPCHPAPLLVGKSRRHSSTDSVVPLIYPCTPRRRRPSHWASIQRRWATAAPASTSWAATRWPPSSLRARWTSCAARICPCPSCWTTPIPCRTSWQRWALPHVSMQAHLDMRRMQGCSTATQMLGSFDCVRSNTEAATVSACG